MDAAAECLYGLIHARYIITTKGLNAMVRAQRRLPPRCVTTPRPLPPPPAAQYDKFVEYDFGRCPRVLCEDAPLLPAGRSDLPRKHTVSLYCPRCNDIYQPKSTRHTSAGGVGAGARRVMPPLTCLATLSPLLLQPWTAPTSARPSRTSSS